MAFDSADAPGSQGKDKQTSLGASDNPYLLDPSTFWRPQNKNEKLAGGTGSTTGDAPVSTTDSKSANAGAAVAAGDRQPVVTRGTRPALRLVSNDGASPFREPSDQTFQPGPGRDMTYRGLRQSTSVIGSLLDGRTFPSALGGAATYQAMYGDRSVPPAPAPGTDLPGGMPTPMQPFGQRNLGERGPIAQLFGRRNRQQWQQADAAGPPQDGQNQPREKRGPVRRLFGRGDAAGPQRTDAAQVQMGKVEFNGADEKGVIREMNLPGNFKLQKPTDPPDGRREFRPAPGSRSKLTYEEGRELSADEQKMLKNVLGQLKKTDTNVPIKPDTDVMDDACVLMGAGYHSFNIQPAVSVQRVNGREVIIMQDHDAKNKATAYSMYIPSDTGKFLYRLTYDGTDAEWPGVKKGIDSIKWRPTPDSVPAPGPRP